MNVSIPLNKLLLLFLGLSITAFGVNPGDTGLETWRTFGKTPQEQMEESGLNTYYPSGIPYEDNCLYWTIRHNCKTCMEFYGLPDHDPYYKVNGKYIGHGFFPMGPYSDFIYVRIFNDYIGGNTIYFNPGEGVDIPDYMHYSSTMGTNWIMLGSGHFPPYAPITVKIKFSDREDIQQLLLDAVAGGNEQFKVSNWIDIQKHYDPIGYEDPIEYEGKWYTNTIFNITYTTNNISNGVVYWVEYHIGDVGVYRITYNEGGNREYRRIPTEYEELPDKYIPEFKPYGDFPTLTFIAKPSKYTAEYGSSKVEYYNILWSTNIVEGRWELMDRVKVYGDNLVTIPLNIVESDQQCFYKLSDYTGIYPVTSSINTNNNVVVYSTN